MAEQNPETTDYLILGGGLSGLFTAMRLTEAGKSFLLLEGRSRLGGRICWAGQDQSLDLGPAWFWPHQQRMQALLRELDIRWFEQYGSGDVVYESAPGQPPTRHPGAGQAISFRAEGGLGRVVEQLAHRIPGERLRLSHEVVGIERHGRGWQLRALHRDQPSSFEAGTLIAALPPRQLLKAAGNAGWASEVLRQELAAQQTWMSAQAKFIATYPRPFWREAGLAGGAFSRVGPMVEIHDASDRAGERPALFGFIGVPASTRQSVQPEELQAACLAQLVRLFGEAAGTPQLALIKDWAGEPLTATPRDLEEMSAHANLTMATHSAELHRLSLYVAGSEFARTEPGYLEGALEAAGNVVTALLEGAA